MANIKSIHSVCNSIIQFLHNAYETTPVPAGTGPIGTTLQDEWPCNFRVLASGELKASTDFGTSLTIYLYRVMVNEHVPRQPIANTRSMPLAVDMHFLVTAWSESAAAEHTLFAWAMSQLYQHPVLDVSSLTEEGGWKKDDVVQIIPTELSNEDMMRIWDALAPDYRLSASYIARVIRIDSEDIAQGKPVVATRFEYDDKRGQ